MSFTIQWFDEDGILLAEEDKKFKTWHDANSYAQSMLDEYSADYYQVN